MPAIHIPIGGIDPTLGRQPGEEKPRLFENLPDHNPPREPTQKGDFLIFIARNPLKRFDSEK
jgi:hypothetical protein